MQVSPVHVNEERGAAVEAAPRPRGFVERMVSFIKFSWSSYVYTIEKW